MYYKISASQEGLLICGYGAVWVLDLNGQVRTVVQGFEGLVCAALWCEDEVIFALEDQVRTTCGHMGRWRDLMRGLGSISGLQMARDRLLIADKDRIVGFDPKKERVFLVVKDGALKPIRALASMGPRIYVLCGNRLGWVEEGVLIFSPVILSAPIALACGKMDGLCGGFRVFVLDGEQIVAYDPQADTLSPVAEPIKGALDLALLGCDIFVLQEHSLVRLDLKTMGIHPIEVEAARGVQVCGPDIDINT